MTEAIGSLTTFRSDSLGEAIGRRLGRGVAEAGPGSRRVVYEALAAVLRESLEAPWQATRERQQSESARSINYLSLEFLMGRSLNNALLNMGLEGEVREVLQSHAIELEDSCAEEADAGLGNGGLGRLAACFLDSCASLALPVRGYGLRYRYGMFWQNIENGYQVEQADDWLRDGNPWEVRRSEEACIVRFRGRSDCFHDASGRRHRHWVETENVRAVPYDTPVPGYRNGVVNTLRLWKSEACEGFDLRAFNAGNHAAAVAAKNAAERITYVLYPDDASEEGRELRLRQQYFLASATLQDVLQRWVQTHGDSFETFAAHNGFQLNDTHPVVAVPELMRLLIDEKGLDWDAAWAITTGSMAYTNHTLLPEALETWPVSLFGALLPRVMDIVHEINRRFLEQVAVRWPGDTGRQKTMAIVSDEPEPVVRMAHLGIIGSYSVNGVAALHTELLKRQTFAEFFELEPGKFNNKTNGVTPRRWLSHCNPALRQLLNESIGEGWMGDLEQLENLRDLADDRQFAARFRDVKRENKSRLARLVREETGVEFEPDWMFTVQVKRIHEYKRQLLNILHVIHLYERVLRGDTAGMQPRCVLFGGKAAPGYEMAKSIIKLINNVAASINADPRARDWLRVAYLPDYRVTSMEVICPGTDLSEQISTAGKEASGTGNMKFMMNGALTIGTLDGANIEIRDAVGAENFFLFGLTAEEVAAKRRSYDPGAIIAGSAELGAVLAMLEGGRFNACEPGIFASIMASICSPADPWMTAADFQSYIAAQRQASALYADRDAWSRKAILNVACSGRFSSDRTIREYQDEIWRRGGEG